MNTRTLLAVAALASAIGLGAAIAQVNPPPQVTAIGPTDLFQDVVGGAPQAGNVYANGALLGNYASTLPGSNPENAIIGGDFGENLFQDGATVSSITTTPTYVADQWAAFSGSSTTLAGAQETGAADITPAYNASLRITRSGSGILQSCVAQEISSYDSYRFQGQTAEIDFHALAGSGFSAAGSVLNVNVVTGTTADEGMANLAHTINTALSGSNWTGKVVATVPVTISGAWNRYSVAVPIPANAAEIGVVFCWTPVGASPSSDYFEFTGAQLTRNSSLTALAGTAGAALNVNDGRAKAFHRDIYGTQQRLQLGFYWRQNESTANVYGVCQETGSTAATCFMTFPVPMFKAPTVAYTAGGISATLGTSQAAIAVTALAIPSNGATVYGSKLSATAASGFTALTGFLEGTGTTGAVAFSARF